MWLAECLGDLAERSVDPSGTYNRAHYAYPPANVDRRGFYCRCVERHVKKQIYNQCRVLQETRELTIFPRYRVSVEYTTEHEAVISVTIGQVFMQQKITPHPDIVWSNFFKSIGAHNG